MPPGRMHRISGQADLPRRAAADAVAIPHRPEQQRRVSGPRQAPPAPNRASRVQADGQGLLSSFEHEPSIHKLLATFIGRLPERVNSLFATLEAKDLEHLRQTIHQLKGAAEGTVSRS